MVRGYRRDFELPCKLQPTDNKMTFTDDTKKEILATLADNRKEFLSATLGLVDDATNKHYRIGLENIQFGDIHSLKDIIEKTILDHENPAFTKNDIIYKVKGLKTVEYEDLSAYFKSISATLKNLSK